jgi:hypothetical protein
MFVGAQNLFRQSEKLAAEVDQTSPNVLISTMVSTA